MEFCEGPYPWRHRHLIVTAPGIIDAVDEPETEDDLLPREGGHADDALAALGIKTEPDREPEPDPEEAEPWQMKWEWEVAMDAVMLELSNELANHCGHGGGVAGHHRQGTPMTSTDRHLTLVPKPRAATAGSQRTAWTGCAHRAGPNRRVPA